jgi:hypothetical protein
MKCYGLGLGLDTFRLVALDANFRKLEDTVTMAAYRRCGVTGQMQTRGCCAGLDALLWFACQIVVFSGWLHWTQTS